MNPMRSPAVTAFLAAFLCTCAGPQRYSGRDPVVFMLRVWVEKNPGLAEADVLSGCELWNVKGVRCLIVPAPEMADVRIFVETGPCKRSDPKDDALARAYVGGKVVFYLECMKTWDGKYDTHAHRAVIGHEIGHQTGIWDHVPKECDGTAVRHPSGNAVCGVAIMNPRYDPKTSFITRLDGLAFDLRKPEYSRLYPIPTAETGKDDAPPYSPAETPDCVFHSN